MEYAVIDRFEGAYAVVLVGDERTHMDVPRNALPSQAREGDWLQITRVEGEIVVVNVDDVATDAARQRIAHKLARLRRGDHLRRDD